MADQIPGLLVDLGIFLIFFVPFSIAVYLTERPYKD